MAATNVIKGVVDNVFTKVKNTRKGDFDINYVVVDGLEFETGFKQVFAKGEMITAGVEHKYGSWQYVEGVPQGTLPAAGAVTGPAAPAVSSSGSRGSGGFPVDAKSGQISIIRQNSMNRAVEILAQWTSYATPLWQPVTEGEYLKKLLEVALIITDFNSGQHIMDLQAAKEGNLQVTA